MRRVQHGGPRLEVAALRRFQLGAFGDRVGHERKQPGEIALVLRAARPGTGAVDDLRLDDDGRDKAWNRQLEYALTCVDRDGPTAPSNCAVASWIAAARERTSSTASRSIVVNAVVRPAMASWIWTISPPSSTHGRPTNSSDTSRASRHTATCCSSLGVTDTTVTQGSHSASCCRLVAHAAQGCREGRALPRSLGRPRSRAKPNRSQARHAAPRWVRRSAQGSADGRRHQEPASTRTPR